MKENLDEAAGHATSTAITDTLTVDHATNHSATMQSALRTAATTPTPEVIPHPALDLLVDSEAQATHRGLDKVVFGVTAAIAVAFLTWGFVSTSSLADVSATGLKWIMVNTGWLFVLTASGFVIFVIWLALGRYGNIPLGRDDEKPEFRTVSWVAMMFSAGMGIGLMFYGVSEPISHFTSPPPGTVQAGDDAATQTALATTLFHWTLHPWAIYAVVGLAIAYGVYRKGRLQLISSAFEGLLGSRVHGPWGKVIDMLAIFATLFGSAASLGLGALQIQSGLQIVAGIGKTGNTVLVAIIAVLTVAFVLSAVSGVAKGIQWLSNINMVLALTLALFVFVVGPTVFILNLVPTAIGSYLQDLAMMSARTGAEGGDVNTWLSGWTVFYWAWWLSWTPFVGMFIARISRGRTIRQFVTGVLLVPSLVSLVWFCIFGGAAIDLQQHGVDIAASGGVETQLFTTLSHFPLAAVASVVVMVLVAIFFVSGADAASIVMGSLSERGALEPRRPTVIFWGVATGAVAAVMLLVGGANALNGLQTITIIAALPFVVVMVALCVALVKDLRSDPLIVRRAYGAGAVENAVIAGVTEHGDDFVISVEKDPSRCSAPVFGTNGSSHD
jgi:choline/carnitine/betaine transport